MINSTKLEIDKIYKKIDKIAKKGNDNFLEYYILFDDLIKKGKYSYLKIFFSIFNLLEHIEIQKI